MSKNKNIYFNHIRPGRSVRFPESKYLTNGPGPGYYLIPGFTHDVLKKNAKYLNKGIDDINYNNVCNNEMINKHEEKTESYELYGNSFNDSRMNNKRNNRINCSNEKIKEELND